MYVCENQPFNNHSKCPIEFGLKSTCLNGRSKWPKMYKNKRLVSWNVFFSTGSCTVNDMIFYRNQIPYFCWQWMMTSNYMWCIDMWYIDKRSTNYLACLIMEQMNKPWIASTIISLINHSFSRKTIAMGELCVKIGTCTYNYFQKQF